jgi:hypothetical protein
MNLFSNRLVRRGISWPRSSNRYLCEHRKPVTGIEERQYAKSGKITKSAGSKGISYLEKTPLLSWTGWVYRRCGIFGCRQPRSFCFECSLARQEHLFPERAGSSSRTARIFAKSSGMNTVVRAATALGRCLLRRESAQIYMAKRQLLHLIFRLEIT